MSYQMVYSSIVAPYRFNIDIENVSICTKCIKISYTHVSSITFHGMFALFMMTKIVEESRGKAIITAQLKYLW